ncbi:MAG: hypothetical protein ACFB5Z_05400 [Elainellaceae cyanobacterium]
MNNSFRTAVCASAIAAAAAPFVGTPDAKAQSVDIPFVGTVLEACVFGVPTPGVLGVSVDGTSLGTAETDGVAGTVTLTCNGDATVSIAEPVFAGATLNDITTLTGYAATASITDGAGTADSTGATFVFGAPNTLTLPTVLNVAMSATTGDPLPTDVYSFTVTVTATP